MEVHKYIEICELYELDRDQTTPEALFERTKKIQREKQYTDFEGNTYKVEGAELRQRNEKRWTIVISVML